MKIIISGVPCCGKTHFGDWLRDNHGFTHANLEGRKVDATFIRPPSISLDLPDWLASLASNVVVTWGFPPNPQCIDIIKRFQATGFTAWWFDADHTVARSRYIIREGLENTERFFDPQIQKLKQAANALAPLYLQHRITTLTEAGYKSLDGIHSTIQT